MTALYRWPLQQPSDRLRAALPRTFRAPSARDQAGANVAADMFGLAAISGVAGVPVWQLVDTVALDTTIVRDHYAELSAAINVALTQDIQVLTAINESLGLAGAADPIVHRVVLITDALGLTDTMRAVYEAAIQDVLALTLTGEYVPTVIMSIVDQLVLTGAATNTLAALAILSDALALASVAKSVQDGTISDVTTFAEVLAAQFSAFEAIVSAAMFSDALVGIAVFTMAINDTVAWDETLTPIASLIAAIRDELEFAVGFNLGDTAYVAYSMNAATKALSSYTNFSFDSLASYNGQTYASGPAGLYRLGGTTDAGAAIPWRIRTGLTNFGTGRNKGMDAAYIGYSATGRVVLKCIVVTPGSGDKIAHWYELTTPVAGAPHAGRIKTGRGLRSVYWAFEMTNVDAGTIELDTLELHPVVFEGRLP